MTTGLQVVEAARQYLGIPYLWGGSTPASGFDCSGLVQYVYHGLGYTLPRTTYTQVKVGRPVASLTQAQPGDLIFSPGSDGTASNPGHVGIYVGGGKMIDAPDTGTVVRVQTVSTVVAIRRIVTGTAGTATAGGAPATLTSATTSGGPGLGKELLGWLLVGAGGAVALFGVVLLSAHGLGSPKGQRAAAKVLRFVK